MISCGGGDQITESGGTHGCGEAAIGLRLNLGQKCLALTISDRVIIRKEYLDDAARTRLANDNALVYMQDRVIEYCVGTNICISEIIDRDAIRVKINANPYVVEDLVVADRVFKSSISCSNYSMSVFSDRIVGDYVSSGRLVNTNTAAAVHECNQIALSVCCASDGVETPI